MKKSLIVFNGGLQTKIDPHLVQPNQAIECINVDLDKGSIHPVKGVTQEQVVNGIYILQEDSVIISNSNPLDERSYARFGTRVYWTNGSYDITSDDSYSPNNIGLAGLFRWDATLGKGIEAAAPVAPDGTVGLASSAANGALNGTYVYTYTYVDTDGIESAPSGYYSIGINNKDSITITISTETNAPTDFSFRRLYRSGGANPTFNLVAEITGLSYVDNTRDIDVSRIELSTISNSAPPTNMKYLVENNGTMWSAVGDKLHFSVNGHPEYWSPLDYVKLNDDITGIGKFADNIVVLTRADAYMVTGYDRDSIAVTKLPYREGCVNHRSISNVGDYLVWVSKNGVCVFNGSSVSVASRNLLSWNDLARADDYTWDSLSAKFDANLGYDVIDSIAFQGNYYGVFSGGVGVLKLVDNVVASVIAVDNAKSIYYDDINNFITVVCDDDGTFNAKSVNTNSSAHTEAIWTTGHIVDGDYNDKKQYRRLKFDDTPVSITVYTNNKEFTVDGKKEFFLPTGFIGNYIQIKITTTNTINSCTYEYGVL